MRPAMKWRWSSRKTTSVGMAHEFGEAALLQFGHVGLSRQHSDVAPEGLGNSRDEVDA
ncbi:hypothetical protein ACFWNT_30225 [Streptomyces sp. NPDC058409]|uniref:hypothetical protein n=2 Tax=unclassified Streptomyces TaxID=2593676 RepID=UPI00366215F7